jgi:hypothetical protein
VRRVEMHLCKFSEQRTRCGVVLCTYISDPTLQSTGFLFFPHSRVDCTRIGIDLHGKRAQKSPPMKEREREREKYIRRVLLLLALYRESMLFATRGEELFFFPFGREVLDTHVRSLSLAVGRPRTN